MIADTHQFLTISMIKGQLDEIYDALLNDLMSRIVSRPREKPSYKLNQPVAQQFTLHVTNVAKQEPQMLVIEELNRLRTFVEGLGDTIDYMKDQLVVAANQNGEMK